MQRPTVKFTYQDYLQLPEDRKRWELIGGDFYVTPAPTFGHQSILANMFLILHGFVTRQNLGIVRFAPLDIYLSEYDVVQPDLVFIATSRSSIITEANIQGAPDLVAEVLSPSTAERDQSLKRRLYARYGVREYWLVDGETRIVTVLTSGGEEFIAAGAYQADEVVTSPLLSGLSFPSRELFTPR